MLSQHLSKIKLRFLKYWWFPKLSTKSGVQWKSLKKLKLASIAHSWLFWLGLLIFFKVRKTNIISFHERTEATVFRAFYYQGGCLFATNPNGKMLFKRLNWSYKTIKRSSVLVVNSAKGCVHNIRSVLFAYPEDIENHFLNAGQDANTQNPMTINKRLHFRNADG